MYAPQCFTCAQMAHSISKGYFEVFLPSFFSRIKMKESTVMFLFVVRNEISRHHYPESWKDMQQITESGTRAYCKC